VIFPKFGLEPIDANTLSKTRVRVLW